MSLKLIPTLPGMPAPNPLSGEDGLCVCCGHPFLEGGEDHANCVSPLPALEPVGCSHWPKRLWPSDDAGPEDAPQDWPADKPHGPCDACAPQQKVSASWCPDEHCPVIKDELEQPRVEFIELARDTDDEKLYVNCNHLHIGEPYKVIKPIKGTNNGNVLVAMWDEGQGEWLRFEVPPNYRLTFAPEYLAKASKPERPSPEARRRRAAHLAAYRRQPVELTPAPAQPDKCTFGTIGANKVLIDAGDGTVLGRYPMQGFDANAEAQKLGRTLVKQGECTSYAITMLRRAWAEAKGGK